mgnify:CR=1 FL=1
MKKKSDKFRDHDSLRRELAGAPHVFVTGFEKMTVQQDFELRKAVRKAGARYRVVKNTVAGKAAEATPAKDLLANLVGMNSLAYTDSDPVGLAKALTEYAKSNPSFTFKAGMVEGRVIDVRSIQELAAMPSREELLARLLFLIQAPAQRVAMAVNALGRNLAVVIDQGCKENKFKAE